MVAQMVYTPQEVALLFKMSDDGKSVIYRHVTTDEQYGLFKFQGNAVKWNRKYAGKTVGYAASALGRKQVRAEYIAWMLQNGVVPEFTVLVKKRGDYSAESLYGGSEVPYVPSSRANNTSSATGVWWCSHRKTWRAEITVGKAKICLGSYGRFETALAARTGAERAVRGLGFRSRKDV